VRPGNSWDLRCCRQ
jgi:hypothetical protein